MKVLFINSVCDYGSTGRIVRDLGNGLKNQGHEVLLCYGRYPTTNKEDTFYYGNSFETKVHGVMTRFFGRHGLHSTPSTKRLISQIEAFKPDVIHIHNVHGYVLNVKLLFEYLATLSIPIYWTLHDSWSFSGSSAYFDYLGCKEWNEGCVVCNSTRDYPRVIGIKRQRKNFKWKKETFTKLQNLTIVTPSQWLKTIADTTFLGKYPIEVVYSGIDTHIFKKREDERLKATYGDKKVLLFIINAWEERKGIHDFIKLCTQIGNEYQGIMIGVPKEHHDTIPECIDVYERTSNAEELAAFYSIAYAFVNPTYEDNYPTVDLEALSCETPVFAYDTGGVKEAADTPYLMVVERGDLDALQKTIESYQYPNSWTDVNQYDKAHFVDKMLQLYCKQVKLENEVINHG